MRKLTALLALGLFLFGAAYAKTIIIYHTSDVHGGYLPRKATWIKDKDVQVGGFAALSAMSKLEKNPVIFLDSGDWYQGTPEGGMTKGMASIELMNAVGYSAAEVGNHEYDYGQESLRNIVAAAKFPVLGANVYLKGTDKRVDYLKPYAIVEKDGIKLGVIGVLTPETAANVFPDYIKDLEFRDEAKEVLKLIPELKARNVNAILVLAHSGINGKYPGRRVDLSSWKPSEKEISGGNIAVARAAKGDVNVIFGGHIHTGLLRGYKDEETGTYMAESYSTLTAFSRVEMHFDDKTGKFLDADITLPDLYIDKTGQDEKILEVLKPIEEKVGKEMDRKVGETLIDLDRNGKTPDTVIGNLVCDILRDYTKTDVVFENLHGLRADIPKGDVTFRSIYQVLPFENTITTMTMTGAQIEELLADNLHNGPANTQLSGLEVVYTLAAGADKAKIVSLSINGKPADPKADYTVTTNNYFATGQSGGDAFLKGRNIVNTPVNMRDVVLDWVKKNSPIKEVKVGRIVKQ